MTRLSFYLSPFSFFLLFAVACDSGAGASSTREEGAATLEIWQGFKLEETAVFRRMMKEFELEWEAANGRDLTVTVHFVAYDDMFPKLRTASLAGLTPDIAFVDAIKVTDLALGQALVKLDELESFKKRYGTRDEARREFIGASFDAGVVNRKGIANLYGLPVQTTTVSMFWNRAIFRAKAGALRAAGLDPNRPPRDWDELIEYGRVLTDVDKGVYGFGMHSSLWFNFPMFNMYGVDVVAYDEAGRALPALDNDNGRAALNRIRTIAASGVEGGAWKRSALFPEAGFLNQKYAMINTGPWMVENFANGGLDFDIALIPAPPQADIDALGLPPKAPEWVEELGIQAWSSSNVGGQTGVIMRTSAQPDIAFEALDYFTSEARQREWASELGQIPVRLAAWEDLDTSKYPFLPRFMQQLRLSQRIPQIVLFGKLELDIFNPEIDLLLQKPDYPVQTMLENMERNLEELILGRINESLPDAGGGSAPKG